MEYKKWVPSETLVACEEKLKELEDKLRPLNLDARAYRLLRAQEIKLETENLITYEWGLLPGDHIEVRYSSGVQKLIYDGLNDYDGRVQLRRILKSGKASKENNVTPVHVKFCSPVQK